MKSWTMWRNRRVERYCNADYILPFRYFTGREGISLPRKPGFSAKKSFYLDVQMTSGMHSLEISKHELLV